MDENSSGDWFGALLQTGQVAAQAYGNIVGAKANAEAQRYIAQSQIAADQRAFQQNLLLRNTPNASGITSPNMILIIMIGVAALFIINQANK